MSSSELSVDPSYWFNTNFKLAIYIKSGMMLILKTRTIFCRVIRWISVITRVPSSRLKLRYSRSFLVEDTRQCSDFHLQNRINQTSNNLNFCRPLFGPQRAAAVRELETSNSMELRANTIRARILSKGTSNSMALLAIYIYTVWIRVAVWICVYTLRTHTDISSKFTYLPCLCIYTHRLYLLI